MVSYYEDKLSAERLRKCYEIAPSRIRQYLKAELDFLIQCTEGSNRILELGCGYGRVIKKLGRPMTEDLGCDTSQRSLRLAKNYLNQLPNVELVCADASSLPFRQNVFDAVFCVQNGISSFGVNQRRLVAEAARVTMVGGLVIFSSYSTKIWKERLAWFRLQAQANLIGEIDETRTRGGTIVCKDGFRATTTSRMRFEKLFTDAGLIPRMRELDGSSLFCLARK